MVENWRIIEEWPDYEVSDLGNVRRAVPSYRANAGNGSIYMYLPAGYPLRAGLDIHGYRG
jgi:hypothetical protein